MIVHSVVKKNTSYLTTVRSVIVKSVFQVTQDGRIGELRKIRLGFRDTTLSKGWLLRKVRILLPDALD